MVLGERTDYQIPQGMGLRSIVFGAQELRYLTPWNQVNGKIWNSQIGTKLTKAQLDKKIQLRVQKTFLLWNVFWKSKLIKWLLIIFLAISFQVVSKNKFGWAVYASRE